MTLGCRPEVLLTLSAQVMAAMGMEKGGPALGLLMDQVLDWQLCHPHGTAEECRQYLQANFSGTADMQR